MQEKIDELIQKFGQDHKINAGRAETLTDREVKGCRTSLHLNDMECRERS
jgi:hypothetical protein